MLLLLPDAQLRWKLGGIDVVVCYLQGFPGPLGEGGSPGSRGAKVFGALLIMWEDVTDRFQW